jgi:hypothetical protein
MEDTYSHVLLVRRLEDSHGRERTGTHGDVRQLVGRAVSVHRVELRPARIDTTDDEVRTNVSLVARPLAHVWVRQ